MVVKVARSGAAALFWWLNLKQERQTNPKQTTTQQNHFAVWRQPPPPAPPFTISQMGGPGPPSSPSTPTLAPSELSSPSPSPLRGGIMTICPTFVLRRKDSAAFVVLLSSKSKAIQGAFGCFHPQRFTTSFLSSWIWGMPRSSQGGGGTASRCGRTTKII